MPLPLDNAAYVAERGGVRCEYPQWWEDNGGQLIQLESGLGTRVKLTDFAVMDRSKLLSCKFIAGNVINFNPAKFNWRLWIYGPYAGADLKQCDAMEIKEWFFYTPKTGYPPSPVLRGVDPIYSGIITEADATGVCLYFTREITQKMDIGMFYLGIAVAEDPRDILEPDISLTPAERVLSKPKLPPVWLYVGDTQRNFHHRHEDIPLLTRSLCP